MFRKIVEIGGGAVLVSGQLLSLVTWIVLAKAIVANGKLTFEGAFVTGTVAGVAPFLFLWLLPALRDPGTLLQTTNLWSNLLAVGITGLLVGLIIAIAATDTADSPASVFSRALGIPALLLGTVTGLNAKADASDAQEAASTAALQDATPTDSVATLDQISVAESPKWLNHLATQSLGSSIAMPT